MAERLLTLGWRGGLELLPALLANLEWREDRLRAAIDSGMYATDVAVEAAVAGVPFREAYKAVEQVAEDKLLSMLPEDLRPAYEDALRPADPEIEQLVKAADKLSAHIKCIEELKAGNTEFRQAAAQTAAAMDAMALPELDYFREHFLPSYGLTLDEMD